MHSNYLLQSDNHQFIFEFSFSPTDPLIPAQQQTEFFLTSPPEEFAIAVSPPAEMFLESSIPSFFEMSVYRSDNRDKCFSWRGMIQDGSKIPFSLKFSDNENCEGYFSPVNTLQQDDDLTFFFDVHYGIGGNRNFEGVMVSAANGQLTS